MNAALAAATAITKPWAAHDTRLIVVTVIGIAIIVVLIVVLLGKLLADSGGADRVIDKLLSKASKAMVPWSIGTRVKQMP
jgi:H+/gluconate symporter-like permease